MQISFPMLALSAVLVTSLPIATPWASEDASKVAAAAPLAGDAKEAKNRAGSSVTGAPGQPHEAVELRLASPDAGSTRTPKASPNADEANAWWTITARLLTAFSPYAWMLLIGFALWYVGRDLLLKVVLGLRKVKGGGFEFEFSAERAREVTRDFQESYQAFLQTAQAEYERQIKARHVHEVLLPNAVEAVRRTTKVPATEKVLRATVHVPDVVFKNFMYQLLDYYPGGSGSGRRFSVRFGVLGRSWRLGMSIGQGAALKPSPGLPAGMDARESAIFTLITQWGMTRTDAEAAYTARNRQSYLCILLVPSGQPTRVPVGILYMDAGAENVFGTDEVATAKARELEDEPAVKVLADAVAKMMTDLSKGAANLAFPGVQ